MRKLLGIDIGGTKCAVVSGSCQGDSCQIHWRKEFATKDAGSTKEVLEKLAQMAEGADFSAIGISCGGPLDSRRGIVFSPPNLPGWDKVPITKFFSERFHVPCFLQNNANACVLAEWKWGNGKNLDNVVFLTFGTGMGAGLILNGKLYEGAKGLAGEIGHMRLARHGPVGYGKAGSFEGVCSGGGIAQLAQSRALELIQQGCAPAFCRGLDWMPRVDARSVAEAARRGDADAQAVWKECGKYLGRGLAVLVDLLAPQAILLGSIYGRCQELLCETMYQTLYEEALQGSDSQCKILPAGLGEAIGDFAALSVADCKVQ